MKKKEKINKIDKYKCFYNVEITILIRNVKNY